MSAPDRATLQAMWRALADRRDWRLAAGDAAAARRCFDRLVGLAADSGDQAAYAGGLVSLGLADAQLGAHRRAATCFGIAAATFQAIGDQRGEGIASANWGLMAFALGDHRKAWELLPRALEIAQAVGDRCGAGVAWGSLSLLAICQGDQPTGIGALLQAVTIARELGEHPHARQIRAHLNGVLALLDRAGHTAVAAVLRAELEDYAAVLPLAREFVAACEGARPAAAPRPDEPSDVDRAGC